MDTQKTIGALPVSTINPSKYGAQGTELLSSPWRPMQWMHDPTQENMQQLENDAALWTLFEKLPSKGAAWTNPTLWWRVENRLNLFTSLTTAMTASDTYISLVAPEMVKAGYVLVLPQTGEEVLVVDVDYDLSEGWTNDGAVACNVRIDRTTLHGPSLAASAGYEVRATAPLMGEQGEPKEGITTIPGDPMYNFIQLFGVYVRMTRMQKASLMAGAYGTHEELTITNESYLKQMIQNTMIFGRRGTQNDADEGMIYRTNGLVQQIKDNVLSLGGVGNTAGYGNISEFIDGTFESANSSASKYVPCGEKLFANILQTARQEGALEEMPKYNPELGVDEFVFKTAGGKNATISKMRYAFQGTLADWGIVLDLANVARGEYADFGWRWLMDLDNPMQGITTKTDALIGSIAVTVRDPDTCGVIKGTSTPLVANRTGLGIVEA